MTNTYQTNELVYLINYNLWGHIKIIYYSGLMFFYLVETDHESFWVAENEFESMAEHMEKKQ